MYEVRNWPSNLFPLVLIVPSNGIRMTSLEKGVFTMVLGFSEGTGFVETKYRRAEAGRLFPL